MHIAVKINALMQYGHFTSPQPCPQQSHLQRKSELRGMQEWPH